MFDFQNSIFENKPQISPTAQIVFVSDMFVEDYVGGAELTTQSLIDASPYEVAKVKSKDVTVEMLKDNNGKFWVFGNFAQLNPQLIPTIVNNVKYSVLEYDYKYCRFRSPEKHAQSAGTPCDCAQQVSGKMVSAFYYGSMGMWWMSKRQQDHYVSKFPFLDKKNVVLSSVFSPRTLDQLKMLRNKTTTRKGWIVLGSDSWIKGADDAKQWCEKHKLQYEVVWNLPYDQVLEKLSCAEGFVYLPKGGDTCPRMVIEAKLLGCKVVLGEHVQHSQEDWFATGDLSAIDAYLRKAPGIFWDGISRMIEYKPTVSGYTTTLNCIKQTYPFEQSIKSMLAFCDEVCVVDGGSTDGTWEKLQALQRESANLKIKQVKRDWGTKRHPVFDGMQKAEARAMCTKEYCWQMDSDEIVHEDDGTKVRDLVRAMPPDIHVMSLPVVEYWGGSDKVRIDVNPWKWRFSRNLPFVTHGIPKELRRTDEDGQLCAAPGTDGCDMINKETGERLQHISFYTEQADSTRKAAMLGIERARSNYEQWFNQIVANVPGVFHYSWYDLPRKIKLYRDYWTRHWVQLAGGDFNDTAEQNMMFDVPWSQVTDEMIEQRAQQLKQIGGWVWHRKWDGQKTPWLTCNRSQPKVMQ